MFCFLVYSVICRRFSVVYWLLFFLQCIGAYTCKRKTGRWPLMVFFNMLDVSAYNAFVVWTEINPDWNKSKSPNRRMFLEDLGKALVSPLIERRKTVPCPYTSASASMALASASMTTSVMAPDASLTPSNHKRRRCKACHPKCNKTSMACQSCNTPICKSHAVIINHCQSCT